MFVFSKFAIPNKFREKREWNFEKYLRFWWNGKHIVKVEKNNRY